ncbi:MAG TPA: hypothetical protein VNK49_07965 [Anaerolineales bacterium]|nr:hypothetical protein [Anaerolineales bacterium]
MNDTEKKEKLELLLRDEQHLSVKDAEVAVQIAENLEDSDFRSWYLSRLAKKIATTKRWDIALKLAKSATGFYDRADALITIAERIAKEQEKQTTVELLNEIITSVNEITSDEVWPWQKAEIFNRAAKLFLQIGDLDSALETWGKAVEIAQVAQNYDIDSSTVLVEIAKELFAAGQLEFAKRVAESIQSVGKREYALKQIT